MLTIVFGFRNRELERVQRCLQSLSKQSVHDFSVIFVDYGSDRLVAENVKMLVEHFEFCRYVYSDTRGYPWNRSKALNVGARLATSEFVMMSDVDMIFPSCFVEKLLNLVRKDRLIGAHCTFLPEHFSDWSALENQQLSWPSFETRLAMGGCQCVATSVFHEIQGFDEFYYFWGIEDRDFEQRLRLMGISKEVLPIDTPMFHQWHVTANQKSAGVMPGNLWGRMEAYYQRNKDEIARNTCCWGQVYTTDDRAIFKYLDPISLTVTENSHYHYLNIQCDRSWEVANFVQKFWGTPSGDCLRIDNADFPGRTNKIDWLIRFTNRMLRLLQSNSRITYSPNLLHWFIFEFIETNPDKIADYFLGVPVTKFTATYIVKR